MGNSQKIFENSRPVAEMGQLFNQILTDFLQFSNLHLIEP
jgi:hypothetical protein